MKIEVYGNVLAAFFLIEEKHPDRRVFGMGCSGGAWCYHYGTKEEPHDENIKTITSKTPTDDVDAWFEQQELLRSVKQAKEEQVTTRRL